MERWKFRVKAAVWVVLYLAIVATAGYAVVTLWMELPDAKLAAALQVFLVISLVYTSVAAAVFAFHLAGSFAIGFDSKEKILTTILFTSVLALLAVLMGITWPILICWAIDDWAAKPVRKQKRGLKPAVSMA